ncbi:Protein sevenless [Camponotus floridanus]|uniref:Protein sevenless n=1 Tax=Camponotus floridanus TaxID=104421 RepID=E2AFI7_CAMFO|nr:Protein sevenless [Camponotus floridanus]
MQIMFGTMLCVLLKDLILTKAIITFIPKDYTPSNSLQEENVSICPNLNFTQDISIFEKSDHHILNFKSDRSHSDSTVRNKREDDEVTNTNVSIIPESIESSLSKPTSLRAFVQFNSQFAEKVNDIFVTLRWNQPEFINEIIQGYTVQCFFIEDLKEIQTCDDKNIITTKLEHTVHNLISNTIYYFRVRAHTKIVAGPYTDLINVSTTHENSIPKLLVITKHDMVILDVDSSITNVVMSEILYSLHNSTNGVFYMTQYPIDRKNIQIQINASVCLFHYSEYNFRDMIIDNMNNEESLIYWLNNWDIVVTDVNISMCNGILHNTEVLDYTRSFRSMTIDKTNIYIIVEHPFPYILYVLKKKYVSLKSVKAAQYVEKIRINSDNYMFYKIYAFDKFLQPYPPMRCLTPDERVYNFENVNATSNTIFVNLPQGVVKSGCKEYNLPTIIYTISVSCLDNNLNKSEKFEVLTAERYYEIQNLTPFTEYKLKYTLSNFYFDQLSINPFDSNVISMKTNSGKLNAPENVSALALKPTIAVVHWMPLKKVNCVAATYEVHWKSVTLANGTQQKGKQFINMPKRTADGRFFTKIHLSLPIQDYLIYVRVYPNNFSDFYNESLSKIDHIYSDPNNITLSEVEINSMDISWISNINLTISSALEYKNVSTEKWQTTNDIRMNYNKEVIYHIENLQSGTLYKFRLILRYLENFIWPADERFIFSTLGKQTKIPIQHNKVADILKNNFIETFQYCKLITKLC